MLKGNTSITISYQSMIGDQVAIYMTGNIPENGNSSNTKNIQNLELYEANKAECRKDMADFDAMLWELEDQRVQTPKNEGSAE